MGRWVSCNKLINKDIHNCHRKDELPWTDFVAGISIGVG